MADAESSPPRPLATAAGAVVNSTALECRVAQAVFSVVSDHQLRFYGGVSLASR